MKISSFIYYAICVSIALLIVFVAIPALPITGSYKVLTVLSGSMEPAIHTGSVVVVGSASDYKIGDVITFSEAKREKTSITHRIVDIKGSESEERSYLTKGDANKTPDQKDVRREDIQGKVIFTIPYAGYAVAEARKPLGFVLIIIIPCLVVIFDEIKKIKRELKEAKQKESSTI